MTTFTEKVEKILDDAFEMGKGLHPEDYPTLKASMLKKAEEAHQAEISRRKEEWEKLRTQHEVGDIVGHYEITDRFKKVGKNTKYRVICKLCGAPMFRYSNRFKTNHKDCPAINKIKGELQ